MKLVSSGKKIMCEGSTAEIIGTFTTVLKELYKDKQIDADDLDTLVSLVKANEEEMNKIFEEKLAEHKEKLKSTIKKMYGKRDVEDIVDEIVDNFFEKEK